MAKVILICGKICSGKTRYCGELIKTHNAVLLSCDEIESMIFNNSLGSRHDETAALIRKYLYKKSLDIIGTGTDVILDWGFWKRSDREEASALYRSRNIPYEWHCIDISEEDWRKNIKARNEASKAGLTTDYYVDDGLLNKIGELFEAPQEEEIDVRYTNRAE